MRGGKLFAGLHKVGEDVRRENQIDAPVRNVGQIASATLLRPNPRPVCASAAGLRDHPGREIQPEDGTHLWGEGDEEAADAATKINHVAIRGEQAPIVHQVHDFPGGCL